jgi:hypothetical protein
MDARHSLARSPSHRNVRNVIGYSSRAWSASSRASRAAPLLGSPLNVQVTDRTSSHLLRLQRPSLLILISTSSASIRGRLDSALPMTARTVYVRSQGGSGETGWSVAHPAQAYLRSVMTAPTANSRTSVRKKDACMLHERPPGPRSVTSGDGPMHQRIVGRRSARFDHLEPEDRWDLRRLAEPPGRLSIARPISGRFRGAPFKFGVPSVRYDLGVWTRWCAPGSC